MLKLAGRSRPAGPRVPVSKTSLAALVLGAQAINLGTRFLASREAPISDGWKQAILSAVSEDAVKAEVDAWAARSNAAGGRVDWRFTTDDARLKLKRLSPSIEE